MTREGAGHTQNTSSSGQDSWADSEIFTDLYYLREPGPGQLNADGSCLWPDPSKFLEQEPI